MKFNRLLASAALAGMLATLAPAPPASADGAASTRNILLGIGAAAATMVIVNQNRKIHERYAQDAATQAALAQKANDAWAAYHAEQSAYQHEVAVVGSLKTELAYQQNQISGLKQQLASANANQHNYVATTVTKVASPVGVQQKVALVSYGWGTF